MGDLREAFDESVRSSRVLSLTIDAGLIEAGRKIADQIDWATENASGQDLTKALYLMPHLVNILREMLATPAARGVEKRESAVGKLASLQSAAGRRSA